MPPSERVINRQELRGQMEPRRRSRPQRTNQNMLASLWARSTSSRTKSRTMRGLASRRSIWALELTHRA